MNHLTLGLISGILAMLALGGCNEKPKEGVSGPTLEMARKSNDAGQAGSSAREEIPQDAQPDIEISLATRGNELAYTESEFEVTSGEVVKLTFRNESSPDSSLFHNVVITMPGKEAEVANDGLQAGEGSGWFEEGPDVIAFVPLIGPGVSTSVTFRAPAPGDYPYICTYPGHASVMRGTLKVREATD